MPNVFIFRQVSLISDPIEDLIGSYFDPIIKLNWVMTKIPYLSPERLYRLIPMTPQELQNLFEKEIPLTKEMGVSVTSVTQYEVHIKAALQPNRNHKGTAFGGSQYALCALACYGLFLNGVRREGQNTNNIVIANGNIQYHAPVTTDFEIIAKWGKSEYQTFFQNLMKNKKAKIQLSALIQSRAGQETCTKFSGDFVAKL
ncbi:MAG: hypothetical protein BroJett040_16530 [Oligoflexia bacterium]|nr:MAG: hypothetical protein BroJett040_16530 [Oligoflexia bacterium]